MWFEGESRDGDVILSSTVTLYRNIKGFPFISRMNAGDKENLLGMVKQAVSETDKDFIRGSELDANMTRNLFDQRLISLKFLDERETNAIILDKKNEGFATVVNGLEHLAIRSSRSGNDIAGAYKDAEDFSVAMEKKLDIAFSEKLGFLTSDIKAIGTGMFIGFLVAIPALDTSAVNMEKLRDWLMKNDWAIREFIRSESGPVRSGLYVIQGTATLGKSEKDIVKRAERVIGEVARLERASRTSLCKKRTTLIEDQFARSYGILRYARKLEKNEAADLIAKIRIGLDGIEAKDIDIDLKRLNKITNMLLSDYSEAEAILLKKPVPLARLRAEKIRKELKGDD